MLRTFFQPAMAIMSRLRFGLKLGVIGLLFLAPIAAVVFFLYAKLAAEISTTQMERLGVQQVVPARYFVRELQNHRGTSRMALNGDNTKKQELAAITSKVDGLLEALRALDEVNGSILKNRDSFARIAKQWLDLKANLPRMGAEESFAAHNKLIDAVFSYMRETADKSNMTLDTDMDSFYIMNPAVFKLPTILASVSRLRALGRVIIPRKAITTDEKTEMTVLKRLFDKDFVGLQSDYDKAMEANAQLAAIIGPKVKETADLAKNFLDNEASAVIAGDFDLPLEKYYERASD
jgi:methyl-accepting chemotaxis protein